jgi:hypothetical protein
MLVGSTDFPYSLKGKGAPCLLLSPRNLHCLLLMS